MKPILLLALLTLPLCSCMDNTKQSWQDLLNSEAHHAGRKAGS